MVHEGLMRRTTPQTGSSRALPATLRNHQELSQACSRTRKVHCILRAHASNRTTCRQQNLRIKNRTTNSSANCNKIKIWNSLWPLLKRAKKRIRREVASMCAISKMKLSSLSSKMVSSICSLIIRNPRGTHLPPQTKPNLRPYFTMKPCSSKVPFKLIANEKHPHMEKVHRHQAIRLHRCPPSFTGRDHKVQKQEKIHNQMQLNRPW